MTMRTHKIRLFPDKEQVILLRKSCGVARFAYNWALNEWKLAYENKENEGLLNNLNIPHPQSDIDLANL